jgi:formylglycine-generating enzyme required for sulfatase activity
VRYGCGVSWIPPHGLRLTLDGRGQIRRHAAGLLLPHLRAHLAAPGPGGLVLLGAFGSGKTTLSAALAGPDVVVVPLRMLVRGGSLAARWQTLVGDPAAVAAGRLRVVLDGLDEVARPGDGDYRSVFDAVTALAGPRWVLTSRTGYFRTDGQHPVPGQVDSLRLPGVETLEIAPLQPDQVARVLGATPLPEICSSPILLRLCLEAQAQDAPTPAVLVDRWLAHVGARADALEALAWQAFRDTGLSQESASFPDLDHPGWQDQPLARLLVQDADGHWRFGHRSLYDYLVARVLAPRLTASQGEGPDELTGLGLSEAMRVFSAGLVARPPVVRDGDWVRVPRGNFVSGGDHAADERPLRIAHLAAPAWIHRSPVTEAQVAAWLAVTGPRPPGYWFLRHWSDGAPRPGTEQRPSYHLRPDDCDAYAAWAGARLPSADEWEKAVRGIGGARYPWGDHPRPGLANTHEHGSGHALPCTALGPQGDSGLLAAVGDVFECTATPWRGRTDRGRVVMGGSFAHAAELGRAGLRPSHTLSGHLLVGMRVARDALE